MVASGKEHGVTPEDIYGCLYFYLSAQLRSFQQRLRSFSISFKFFSMDATDLARLTRGGTMANYGIPPSVRFDRIFVSNIFDLVYVGLRAVLESWAPFLSNTPSAAIVGYLMNWFTYVPDGEPRGTALSDIERQQGVCVAHLLPIETLTNRDADSKETSNYVKCVSPGSTHHPSSDVHAEGLNECCSMMDETDMLYDNSAAFMKYLKQQGLDAALQKTGLQLRAKNAIVPQVRGLLLPDTYSDSYPALRNTIGISCQCPSRF